MTLAAELDVLASSSQIKTVAMKDAFSTIANGMNVRQGREGTGLPISRIETISDGRINLTKCGYAGISVSEAEKWCLRAGEILFSHINSPEQVGKCALVEAQHLPLVHGMNLLRLVPRPEVLDSRFALHYLRARAFRSQLRRFVNQAVNQASVSISNLKTLELRLPPLDEQRRIASILDKVDELRSKRRQALAQLAVLPQSIYMDMFGDPIANDACLPVRELQTLLDENRPLTYGILMPGPDQEVGVKYVRVTDIQDGRIQESTVRSTTPEIAEKYRRSTLRPGDLLMSIRGHVGRFAVVPATLDGANITQDTARLAVSGAEVTYVRECLSTPGLQRWMVRHTKGVAVRGINLGDVRRIPIPVAPVEKQELFARKIEAVERLQDHGRAHLVELEKLFAALQYRAFRG